MSTSSFASWWTDSLCADSPTGSPSSPPSLPYASLETFSSPRWPKTPALVVRIELLWMKWPRRGGGKWRLSRNHVLRAFTRLPVWGLEVRLNVNGCQCLKSRNVMWTVAIVVQATLLSLPGEHLHRRDASLLKGVPHPSERIRNLWRLSLIPPQLTFESTYSYTSACMKTNVSEINRLPLCARLSALTCSNIKRLVACR